MLDSLGWIATAVFTLSYFAKGPDKLRWIQAVAALFWMTYGLAIHALPVIVANLIVTVAAVYSGVQLSREKAKNAAAAAE
jgi:inner membrane protein